MAGPVKIRKREPRETPSSAYAAAYPSIGRVIAISAAQLVATSAARYAELRKRSHGRVRDAHPLEPLNPDCAVSQMAA